MALLTLLIAVVCALLAAVALAVLASHVYTVYTLRHSRLLSGALPLLGHLGVLKAQTKRHKDVVLGLRAMAREAKDSVFTVLMGTRGMTIVGNPQMVRAVLNSTDFNSRPTRPKWQIMSLVRGRGHAREGRGRHGGKGADGGDLRFFSPLLSLYLLSSLP